MQGGWWMKAMMSRAAEKLSKRDKKDYKTKLSLLDQEAT